MKPKISVITVVKNGYPYIKESVDSFISQNYQNKELIIVYSKSSDQTENYLKSFKNKFKLIHDYNSKNMYGSINVGLKNVTGQIICLLHSDDVFDGTNILSSISKEYMKNNFKMLYGDIKFSKRDNINKIVRYWQSGEFRLTNLKFGWVPPHTSIFLDKSVAINNLYSTDFSISGDYDYILNLLLKKKIFPFYLKKNLIIMRNGGNSTKITKLFVKLFQDIKIARKYFRFFFLITVFFKIFRKVNQILY